MAATRPLRIIHCFRSPIGGIFRHVRDLVEEHAAAGHEVGILCDSSTGGAYEDALFQALRPSLALGLMRLPIRRAITPGDLLALRQSYRHIQSLQPDVLHGHGAKGGVVARLIGSTLRANKYRVARLYSPHGGSLHYSRSSITGQIVLRLERLLERFCDQLVFVCDYERRTYEERVGKPQVPNIVIYNGIRDSEFEAIQSVQNAADFLYIGMMRDLKGPDVFIDAFQRAEHETGRSLSALMVGDGPDKERYREMLQARGLRDRIKMHDAMPAPRAFALADIVVVPSRAEAMPYIVLEALAAEKPLIATKVGGIPEVLGKDNAALAKPGDAEDLARLMAEARTNADWQEINMPRPASFQQRFSASVMAGTMIELYNHLIQSQSSKLS